MDKINNRDTNKLTVEELKQLRDGFKDTLWNDPRLAAILASDGKRIVMNEASIEHLHHQFGYYQALEEILETLSYKDSDISTKPTAKE